MRKHAFALLALSAMPSAAMAADPPSYQEQYRCVAVFNVTSELFAKDGSVPEMVDKLKSMQERMSTEAFLNVPGDKVKESGDIQTAEEDRLIAMWNEADDEAAQDKVMDYFFEQIDGCDALLSKD